MSGVDIAVEVAAGIAEASAELNDGTPLVGQLLQPGVADRSTTPPTPGVATSHDVTLLLSSYDASDIDGVQITATDILAMVSTDTDTVPTNKDKLTVSGKTYDVVNVVSVNPGGVDLMWECQLRGIDG